MPNLTDKYLFKLVKHFPRWLKPNHITILRLLFLIPIVYLLITSHYLLLLIVILLAYATDLLDGPLARLRGQSSALGVFLDPVADRLIFFVPFCWLGYSSLPTRWFWLLIIGELMIFILAWFYVWLLTRIQIKFEFTSNLGGKFKALMQLLILVFLLLFLISQKNWLLNFSTGSLQLCLLFLFISLGQAIRKAKY